ncbi:hypothetical protein ACQ858_15875 [Variovorax ureilyticus]|uniref:hypothetical protein n=1 Tax=Variovorax ureilyticus TaxID=1836198 RepID=UPI003D679D2C
MTIYEITIDTQAFKNLDNSDAPLFEQWQGQMGNAYLLLDEDGVCTLETRAPWENLSPAAEWHGRTQMWALPANASGVALHTLLTDEDTIELLQRVYDGHSIDWDGNNYAGMLDDDATEAYDELERLFATLGGDFADFGACWPVWSTDEWLAMSDLSELWPAGKTLAQAVAAILKQARDERVICGDSDDVEAELLERLQHKLDHDDKFEPTAEQRAALDD